MKNTLNFELLSHLRNYWFTLNIATRKSRSFLVQDNKGSCLSSIRYCELHSEECVFLALGNLFNICLKKKEIYWFNLIPWPFLPNCVTTAFLIKRGYLCVAFDLFHDLGLFVTASDGEVSSVPLSFCASFLSKSLIAYQSSSHAVLAVFNLLA